MEFILLPIHRGQSPIPVPRTPYVSRERYDGGPWMSYPERKGKNITAWDGESFNLMEHHRSERVNPTPVAELEAFLQTWLYFGLLAEFINGPQDEGEHESPEPNKTTEVLDAIYMAIVFKEGNGSYVKLSIETLDSCVKLAISRLPPDSAGRIQRFNHLTLCLTYAHPMLSNVPKEFNHAVKYSISALAELLTHTANFVLERLGIQPTFGRTWSNGFLTEELRISMRDHGWCPSDITRAESKYSSVQTLYMARMLDKSLPERNHSHCTETACKLYQINMGVYQVGHQHKDCSCLQLEVSSEELTQILKRGERFPLLRFTGDLDDLSAELVECSDDTPYVAISHVWADGLGNPYANSLHRCKLLHLRNLVAMLPVGDSQDSPISKPPLLIWLDTLCCPAEDGDGKQMAIEKIRLVYRKAKHVLVLDSGLMAYDAQSQDVSEMVARVYTSSWMRRLWTLQEGALAQSLYFQFADKAIGMLDLTQTLVKLQKEGSMRHRAVLQDVLKEFMGLAAFFNGGKEPTITLLDESLKYRSVSVLTDEPLCIGTLMSLDLHAILSIEPKQDRMQKVWELIAAKMGGIPTQVIMFQEERIDSPGWKWAPRSLLAMDKGIHGFSSRLVRWSDTQLGSITPRGLRVRYPGYRMSLAPAYGDGKPQNPWPGFERIPEPYIHFRDAVTGTWFRIADKGHAFDSQNWETEEERAAYNELGLFPLHDVVNTDRSVVIVRSIGEDVLEAVLATTSSESVVGSEGIAVETQRFVIVMALQSDDGHIYDTVRRLAFELRAHPLTESHLELCDRLAEEYGRSGDEPEKEPGEEDLLKESVRLLKEKMKDMMRDVAASDERFVKAVSENFGGSFLDSLWVLIHDFFHHDYVGEKLPDEQIWFVD